MRIYKKYNQDIYTIYEIFGIKIIIKNKYLQFEKLINSRIYNLSQKLDILDLRNKARMSLLAMDRKKIITSFREEKLIVSLTTYPQRISDIDVVLYSLLIQTIKPDKIILWLSEEEFPNKLNDVPLHILRFLDFGVEIEFCDNIRSYKKLVYALNKYPNDLIVTADDDIYYPYNWLELLYNSYLKQPNYIHCHRALKIQIDNNNNIMPITEWMKKGLLDSCKEDILPSFRNYFTTGGGVIFKKAFLNEQYSNKDLFMNLAPTEDDKWFFTMAILNNTKVNVIKNNIFNIIELGYENYTKLYDINKTGVNYTTFIKLMEYFNLKEKLLNDN